MSTNIVVALDTRRTNSSGQFPLVLRLGHNRRTTAIPLNVYLYEKDWDEKSRQVKKTYGGSETVTRLNNRIQKEKADGLDIILKLQESGEINQLSVVDIRKRISKDSSSASFFTFAKEQVDQLNISQRFGTARSYKGLAEVLSSYINNRNLSFKGIPCFKWLTRRLTIAKTKNSPEAYRQVVAGFITYLSKKDLPQNDLIYFNNLTDKLKSVDKLGTVQAYHECIKANIPERDLTFKEITYGFLSKFESFHYSKGNSSNGLAVYMRTIRAIYRKGIKSGLVDKEYYPFEDYKVKTKPTEKRALDWEDIKKMIDIELTPDNRCFDARNYFLASYMMYGITFKDMALLKKSDITNGRVLYHRSKTGKIYDIKITTNLQSIIDHYQSQDPGSEYIFPIIKRKSPIAQEKDIQWARKVYNGKLKELAVMCLIDKNLTSYVSRHSFATRAMLQLVPLNAISTMLGHSSLKTTEIYLKSLPSNLIDEYNERVLQY